MAGDARGAPGIYSIGSVAKMLATPAATIRNWEERYGSIVPERSPGGHRMYSPDQVEQLRFVASQVARGFSAADAHRLLAAQRQTGEPPANEPSTGSMRGLVLLAERDRLSADPEQFALRSEGYEVTLALSAAEAEEIWREVQPPLALVELMISGGQGAELCRRLKEEGAGAVVAMCVLEIREQALAAGADVFLQKPFDPLELVATVKDVLGTNRPAHIAAAESR